MPNTIQSTSPLVHVPVCYCSTFLLLSLLSVSSVCAQESVIQLKKGVMIIGVAEVLMMVIASEEEEEEEQFKI